MRDVYTNESPDIAKVHEGSRLNVWPFLMPNDRVDYRLLYPAGSQFMKAMLAQKTDEAVWLVAEIDYKDVFGAFHRNGYGRVCRPDSARFVQDESTRTLNYDRYLTADEIRRREYKT